jgi:hypothetical protein
MRAGRWFAGVEVGICCDGFAPAEQIPPARSAISPQHQMPEGYLRGEP